VLRRWMVASAGARWRHERRLLTARVVWEDEDWREPDGVIDFVDANPANLRWRKPAGADARPASAVGRRTAAVGTGVRGVYKEARRVPAQLWRAGRPSAGHLTSLRAAAGPSAALSQVLEGNWPAGCPDG